MNYVVAAVSFFGALLTFIVLLPAYNAFMANLRPLFSGAVYTSLNALIVVLLAAIIYQFVMKVTNPEPASYNNGDY